MTLTVFDGQDFRAESRDVLEVREGRSMSPVVRRTWSQLLLDRIRSCSLSLVERIVKNL